MNNKKQFIAIFFFEHRSPVRYHVINLLSLSQFIYRRFGAWSSVNVYDKQHYFRKQFKPTEYLPSRLFEYFNN